MKEKSKLMYEEQIRFEFEWINEDCIANEFNLVETAAFILDQTQEHEGEGKVILYTGLDESFGFVHTLYKDR